MDSNVGGVFVNTARRAHYAVMSLVQVVAHIAFTISSAQNAVNAVLAKGIANTVKKGHNVGTLIAMGVVRFVPTIYNDRGAEFAARGLYFAHIKNEKINVQSVTLLAIRKNECAI